MGGYGPVARLAQGDDRRPVARRLCGAGRSEVDRRKEEKGHKPHEIAQWLVDDAKHDASCG
jgi:hypothetical protein